MPRHWFVAVIVVLLLAVTATSLSGCLSTRRQYGRPFGNFN
jgi:hypothetical protein